MTSKSRAQVDKEIHIRRTGGKVGSPTGAARKVATPKARSRAEVDRDALSRQMGNKVPARGKASDAATGRLKKFDPRKHHRDLIGRFD